MTIITNKKLVTHKKSQNKRLLHITYVFLFQCKMQKKNVKLKHLNYTGFMFEWRGIIGQQKTKNK